MEKRSKKTVVVILLIAILVLFIIGILYIKIFGEPAVTKEQVFESNLKLLKASIEAQSVIYVSNGDGNFDLSDICGSDKKADIKYNFSSFLDVSDYSKITCNPDDNIFVFKVTSTKEYDNIEKTLVCDYTDENLECSIKE